MCVCRCVSCVCVCIQGVYHACKKYGKIHQLVVVTEDRSTQVDMSDFKDECAECMTDHDEDPDLQLLSCPVCHDELYCSEECRQNHWPRHQLYCQQHV